MINANKEKIDLNVNLWITANAGCGKTTYLIKRFLFLLKNNIKPEEIVCITYTDVASKEIIKRIITEAKKENIYIQESKLRISTIHGFCRRLLVANNLLSNDISLLANDKLATSEMVKKIINDFNNNINDKQTKIINEISKVKNIESFYDLIEDIIKKQIYFFELFEKIIIKDKLKNDNFFDCVDENKIYHLLPNEMQDYVNNINILSKEKEEIEKYLINNLGFLQKQIYKFIENKKNNKKEENLDIYEDIIKEQNLKKIDTWRNIVLNKDSSPKKKIDASLKEIEVFFLKIQDFFLRETAQQCAIMTNSILHFALEVLKKYHSFKKEMNVNTYDDFLFQTHINLLNDCLFKDINNSSNIKCLMLDEAQDTNPISWKIIEKIVEKTKCNFFIIGDEKQSIYRFQGAKVEEYEKNKNIFRDLSKKLNINFNSDIKLSTSYRSTQPILDEADKLCQNNKNSFVNYIKHESCEEKLKKKPNGYILEQKEAILVENYNMKENSQEEEKENEWLTRTNNLKLKQEQKKQKIKNLTEKVYKYILQNKKDIDNNIIDIEDNKCNIAIISYRLEQNILDVLSELQNNYNVNIITDKIMNNIYYNDILLILNFFILQNDSINLACLLKSEIFNFTDEMLAKICLSDNNKISPKNTLWNLMKRRIFDDKEENDKLIYAINYLDNILNCKTIDDILSLIEKIVEDKKNKKYYLPLKIIKKYAKNYCEENQINNYDIRSFILQFESFEKINKEEIVIDNNELNVFFNTIHGVKGMEFDTVIYFDNEECRKENNDNRMIFLDNCFWYKKENIKKNDPMIQLTEKDKQQKENEKLRLKYVAITRAKRKLIYFKEEKEKQSLN